MTLFLRNTLTYLFLLLFTGFYLNSQTLKLSISNEKSLPLKRFDYSKTHRSKVSALNELNKISNYYQEKGYLLAAFDTLEQTSQNLSVDLVAGPRYTWAKIKVGNLNPTLASKFGFKETYYASKPVQFKKIIQLKDKVLNYYENNGYPFVSFKLDSVESSENGLNAVINVQKNQFIKLDSVVISGNAKVNEKFIYRYISISPGKPYNESALNKCSNALQQLPFLKQKKPQLVRLTDKTNKLILFLDKKEASQFDGIVGVQPNTTTGKTIITGDVKIKLVNGILRNGETFDLEWRRLQELTQDFKGKLIYPYMFGSTFGTDYMLKIYKKDTSFIDISNDLGIHYYFSGLNYIKLQIKQRNSNLISTYGLNSVTTLPNFADVTTQQNGFGFFFEKLDYRFNPKKGISIQMNASAGSKRIRKNPKINDIAYNSILLNSTQYNYDAIINTYTHLGGNNVLKIGIQSASIFGNAPIFRNEFLRIGGLRTLRGFDEESIFTTFYVIPTIEYRFLFSRNSSIIVFTEGAFYEANGFNSYLNDTPISVGTGINFETKAGILSINYAIGNQFSNGFDARNGKIHFGLTALF